MIKELNKNQLDKNWEVKRLGDVCSFHNGKGHEKSIDENGKYKVVNSKFVSSNGKKAKRTDIAKFPLLKEDIVMVMSDVPNGKTLAKCFLIDKDDEYSLNQRVCAFRTTSFDKDFLFYQLNRNKYFLAFNNGENQSNLRKGDILDCPLLIPPLSQQKQIVAILDKAFIAIDTAKVNAEKNLQNAKELFESYLQNVFENKGADWEEKTLGDLCEISPKKSELNNLPENHLVSFLPMKDLGIAQNQINPITIKQLSQVKGSYTYFRNNDVLLAKVTPCFENGKLGIAKNLKNDVGFGSSEFIVFRTKNEILAEYIFYILSSSKFRNRGKELMFGAVGLKRLSKDYVKNFAVPFPKLEEQKQIVEKLDSLSIETKKLESIYTQKLADLEEMKKSVLQKAFSGQLSSLN